MSCETIHKSDRPGWPAPNLASDAAAREGQSWRHARAALTGDSLHRAAAEAALVPLMPLARTTPRFTGWAWATAVAHLAGPAQVAIALPRDAPPAEAVALHAAALRSTSPGLVVAVGGPGDSAVPLIADRPPVGGLPTAYPCRGFVCDLPVTTADDLRRALGDGP